MMSFRTLVIGETFRLNGNTYIKKSTRTAKMIGLGKLGDYCKTFYIEQLAPCEPIEGMWRKTQDTAWDSLRTKFENDPEMMGVLQRLSDR